MTPLKPVKFTASALSDIRAIDEKGAERVIYDEVHNHICRLRRPYETVQKDGASITRVISPTGGVEYKNYFEYTRKRFGFVIRFYAEKDGYIYVVRVVKTKKISYEL